MLISKAPLRISLFGGGSDIPSYYEKHGAGYCLSTTIDKYIYLSMNKCVADHLRIVYSKMEQVYDVEDIEHDRVREACKHFSITRNLELASFSDIPTHGTGLGSSSAFTAALVLGLYQLKYPHRSLFSRESIAETACYIEIEKCKEFIGKQDQYASAFGGLNLYTFEAKRTKVTPISLEQTDIDEFKQNLLLFDTGIRREASVILYDQVTSLQSNSNTVDNTKLLTDIAMDAVGLLESKNYDAIGHLLDESWNIKRTLAKKISNPLIDEIYTNAKLLGALGGKLLGAGGGGYMLFYVNNDHKNFIHNLITKHNFLRHVSYNFEREGTTVREI